MASAFVEMYFVCFQISLFGDNILPFQDLFLWNKLERLLAETECGAHFGPLYKPEICFDLLSTEPLEIGPGITNPYKRALG